MIYIIVNKIKAVRASIYIDLNIIIYFYYFSLLRSLFFPFILLPRYNYSALLIININIFINI